MVEDRNDLRPFIADETLFGALDELWRFQPWGSNRAAFFPTVFWSRGYIVPLEDLKNVSKISKKLLKPRKFGVFVCCVVLGAFVTAPFVSILGYILLSLLILHAHTRLRIEPKIDQALAEMVGPMERGGSISLASVIFTRLITEHLRKRYVRHATAERPSEQSRVAEKLQRMPVTVFMIAIMLLFAFTPFITVIDRFLFTDPLSIFPLPRHFTTGEAFWGWYWQASFAHMLIFIFLLWAAKYTAIFGFRMVRGHHMMLADVVPHFAGCDDDFLKSSAQRQWEERASQAEHQRPVKAE